jgi:hypothetical protein
MITSKEVIISVSKTISKKILYVVVALAMLAMMIPMAIPVSAAGGTIAMYLVNPVTGALMPEATGTTGYNIANSTVQVTVTNDVVASWTVTDWGTGVTGPIAGAVQTVSVTGINTESTITAHMTDNTTLSVDKKWALIDHTTITAPGTSYVTWNEEAKAWSGSATIRDYVYGNFINTAPPSHVIEGAILNWYLIPGNVTVPMAAGEYPTLKAAMLALSNPGPSHVNFTGDGHYMQTVTGAAGWNEVGLTATGEEAVQVVVIPEYPGLSQQLVTPEVTTWDFFTTEMEVVPQVRWAGEKIVLEKYFGPTYNEEMVKFSLQNQSVGALEGIQGVTNYVNAGAVWTPVVNGFASCILVSSDAGVANVTAGLYEGVEGPAFLGGVLINQHFFTTYFLKFESISLGDVQGKRTMHNSGPWELIPGSLTNPWDPTGSYSGTQNPALIDNATQTLNISQDALLRARVKGWFTSSNPSVRVERRIDPANSTLTDPGSATLLLPAGRWVLPDDWAALAGPNWKQSRMHWDIMCDPYGRLYPTLQNAVVTALLPMGDYTKGATVVGKANVVGPFSPGLELMTPAGWEITNAPLNDPTYRPIHTVVPDGELNVWDAPMPSAKIIFQIQNPVDVVTANGIVSAQNGFFKATSKTDVYFVPGAVGAPTYSDRKYTNPFYFAYIPAHEAIPAFINNGGYDWDSFDPTYGPYMFWEFINQNKYTPIVVSADPANHPTTVEVYSDNHGEAMVWLNGNWNNDLNRWLYQASTQDIPIGTIVGYTTVQATADYPYSRLHQVVQSNLDVKTWTWGQQVLGTDRHHFSGLPDTWSVSADTRMVLSVGNYDNAVGGSKVGTYPNEAAKSVDKMVWVWITDRDGTRAGVSDAKITWTIGNLRGTGAKIAALDTGRGISGYNDVTQNIYLDHGFLAMGDASPLPANMTSTTIPTFPAGLYGASADRLSGTSTVIVPTGKLIDLFNKFWGPSPVNNPANPGGTSNIRANVNGYMVAGVKISAQTDYMDSASVRIEITSHDFDMTWNQVSPGTVTYTTVVDFNVIDALDDGIRTGDANCDGYVNMGDVTAVENMILGYKPVTSNAILNNDGTVDMGTVVKIERSILGYK